MEYIFSKERSWLERWDKFNFDHPKGSHLICTDWLKSYGSYGFDFELGLLVENDKIVGGYGAILPKIAIFKFYIIPHGPIFQSDSEQDMENQLTQIKRRAKEKGCCYLQLSLPISDNPQIMKHSYGKKAASALTKNMKSGKLFKHIYSSYGLNWVDFGKMENHELFLENLTPKVRRNIRMPNNKGAVATIVSNMEIIEKGYGMIIENANFGNYSVRTFDDISATIKNLIDKDRAYFVICEVENEIKAAAFFVKSNGFITNITGGVLREKPDIKLGYMLQWEIIKKSYELNYDGYNISMGGSAGVQDFKSKFGAESIIYEGPHYHVILRPLYFKMFTTVDRYLKPYKAQISKLLSRFKG
ncbi:MAG: lipid II:glycine glycyltransferase FemX [Aquaticitalea sp.]